MPTYEYHCPENGQTVSVFHGIRDRLHTWGEVCEMASIHVGVTSPDEMVERVIGAGSFFVKRPGQLANPVSGGCCGTHGCSD